MTGFVYTKIETAATFIKFEHGQHFLKANIVSVLLFCSPTPDKAGADERRGEERRRRVKMSPKEK